MTIIAAAICSILLAPGSHALECTAYYLHTTPAGVRYQATKTHSYTSGWPYNMKCAGRGHPYKVEMKDHGVVVCSDEVPLFESGFETGDLSEWS